MATGGVFRSRFLPSKAMILLIETSTLNCSVALGQPDGTLLDARAESSARVLSTHFRANVYVSMCGPLGVVSCARVVGPSGPKDVPVTIYMSCMMVWCVWNHSQRTRTRGIVHEDQGNLWPKQLVRVDR